MKKIFEFLKRNKVRIIIIIIIVIVSLIVFRSVVMGIMILLSLFVANRSKKDIEGINKNIEEIDKKIEVKKEERKELDKKIEKNEEKINEIKKEEYDLDEIKQWLKNKKKEAIR